MKKLFLVIGVLGLLALASCNKNEKECSCVGLTGESTITIDESENCFEEGAKKAKVCEDKK
jgi:hypothetical protein